MSASLTARQVQILELMADGMTAAEIAERLLVSEQTVFTHRTLLRDKLGARNSAHAVHLGHKAGHLGGDAR